MDKESTYQIYAAFVISDMKSGIFGADHEKARLVKNMPLFIPQIAKYLTPFHGRLCSSI
jgi:hypothetical protein